MPDSLPLEQRQHPRSPIVRACKVRPSGALRFDGGTTVDASWGGIALRLTTNRRFTTGDRVDLVIAWEDEPIATGPVARATVRRVLPASAGEQRLALELERAQSATEDIAAA